MSRIVGYARVSDPKQTDNFSLPAQRHSIERACEFHGHELVRIYADEGQSAFKDTLKNRPQLAAAIDAILAGEAEFLMVDKLDRLARNVRVFHDILHRLNARVIFVREGIDPTSPTGELVTGILAQTAQFFSRNLGVETKKGKQERVAKGLWLGPLPYGYVKQPGDERGKLPPRIDDRPSFTGPDGEPWSRGDVVRHVFRRAGEGVTRRAITAELQALGAPDISRALVDHMLRSRFYLGELPQGRTSRSSGAATWLPGAHPALVDWPTLDRAQRASQQNRVGVSVLRSSARVSPLSGVVRCGRCNAPMHCQRERDRIRLFCSRRARDGSCDQISVLTERLEEQVKGCLHAYSPPPDVVEALVAAIADPTEDSAVNVVALREEIALVRDLYFEHGAISRQDYQLRLTELEQRRHEFEVRGETDDTLRLTAEYLAELPKAWDAAQTAEQRNQLVRAVFRELLVDNQEIVAVRVKPGIDAMLRERGRQVTIDLAHAGSEMRQVYGAPADLATYFRPLPDGYWAVPLLATGIKSYPKIPRAFWPQVAAEYRGGMSGPKLAERWGVRSSRTIYLILQKQAAVVGGVEGPAPRDIPPK